MKFCRLEDSTFTNKVTRWLKLHNVNVDIFALFHFLHEKFVVLKVLQLNFNAYDSGSLNRVREIIDDISSLHENNGFKQISNKNCCQCFSLP